MVDTTRHENTLNLLTDALESGSMQRVRRMLHSLHPAEIARLLESLPHTERNLLWEITDPDEDGEILLQVNDEVRERLIRRMEPEELVNALDGMAVDDLADILDDIPHQVTDQVLRAMTQQERQFLAAVRSYPEDSAGGLMDTDLVTIRPDVTLDVVLRYLRMRGSMPENSDSLFVVDRYNKYLGVLKLSELITQDAELTVAEITHSEIKGIDANLPATEVTRLFENLDLLSAPVINESGELAGRITIDDVVDVIREEAERTLMNSAGLDDEEDMFAPVMRSARRRGVWLGINLLTALLASWVVGLFQATINEVVALAVLMPVVASMGGIAGSQTLTLVIRGQALGQITRINARTILNREVVISVLNSLGWALLLAVIALIWFDNVKLGIVIASAIIINMVVAAASGFLVPMTLKKMNIDPALAGSVVLTTITDVVGFFAFLGLGTIILL